MYARIYLNNLRYETHKLHFLNFFKSELLCMVSKLPLHEPKFFRMVDHDFVEKLFGNSCSHT